MLHQEEKRRLRELALLQAENEWLEREIWQEWEQLSEKEQNVAKIEVVFEKENIKQEEHE